MATAATASGPAAASSSPAAVCLVPFRWWARVREEAAAGGVQYAATAAASPSYYGLRLLHSFLHPDLVLRASTAGSAAPLPAAATRLSRPTSSRGRSPGRTLVWHKINIHLLETVLVLILWCLGYLSMKQVF